MKIRLLSLLLVLVLFLSACGQPKGQASSPAPTDELSPTPLPTEAGPVVEPLSVWQADLTHDGTDETVTVSLADDSGREFTVTVKNSRGDVIWQDQAGSYRGLGYNGIYLFRQEGRTYLMYWRPNSSQGIYFPSCQIFSLTESGDPVFYEEHALEYSVISNEELLAMDLTAIEAFETRINNLLADSIVLITTYDDHPLYSTPDAPASVTWDADLDGWRAKQDAARK